MIFLDRRCRNWLNAWSGSQVARSTSTFQGSILEDGREDAILCCAEWLVERNWANIWLAFECGELTSLASYYVYTSCPRLMLCNVQLKPYVFKARSATIPRDWPVAADKPEEHLNSRRGGMYGPRGFDGAYYLQLMELKKPSS